MQVLNKFHLLKFSKTRPENILISLRCAHLSEGMFSDVAVPIPIEIGAMQWEAAVSYFP